MMATTLIITKSWFRWIFWFITGLIFLDVVAFIIFQNHIFYDLFKITTEKNVPTLFSTVQLIFSGSLLRILYQASKRSEVTPYVCSFLNSLSFIFFFLAFDEWFTVHDIIGSLFSDYMGAIGDVFGWTLLYLIIMSVFFVWSLRFLFYLPLKTAMGLVLSGALFLIGAIGFELLNTPEFKLAFNLEWGSFAGYLIGLIEEACEMYSILMFNFILFLYGSERFESFHFSISKKGYGLIIVFAAFDIVGTFLVRLFN